MNADPTDNQLTQDDAPTVLSEHQDYYFEGQALVFTASYHLRRGYCCGNGCRHCPFENGIPKDRT